VIVCKSSQNNETGFGFGLKTVKAHRSLRLRVVLGADDTVFALLLGFIKRFINAHHQLLQRLHIPFPQPALKVTVRPSSRQVRSTFTRQLSSSVGRYQYVRQERSPQTLRRRSGKGNFQRLEDLQPFAGDVAQNDIAVEVTPGVVDRFEVIDIDQRESERLMIVHQRGDIAVEGAAVFAAGERVDGRLADVGQFALLIAFNGFTQHRFQARGAFDVAGFNRIDDIHQHGTGSMTQIKAEQDDDDRGEGKPPITILVSWRVRLTSVALSTR
jgi:hypothetical protein